MEEGPAPGQGFGLTGPGRTSAELNPGGPKRCPGARDSTCIGRGTLRRSCSLRFATAAMLMAAGVARRRRGGRGGARAETGSASAQCYDTLNRGRSLSGDARRRGGVWRPRESLDQVGRCGPRRLQCVRRTARGQRGRPEESKPQSERNRPARSEDAEHPGSWLQHVSTSPFPREACSSSLSPVGPTRAVLKWLRHALPASVIPSQSMPSHTHPESSFRSTPPPKNTPRSVTHWEGGGN